MSNISDAAAPVPHPELGRIVERMFRRLMPLLVFGYILNFLDRTNISLAKAALQADVGISAAAYGLGAGLFFLAYSVCEVPSNLILQRVGARRWIARIMLSWGVVSMGMALVKGPVSFYALRVLLGIAEAGLFPGVLLYLTYWFGERERARAIGYFLLGVCLANVIGAPISGALLELDGALGLKGWQWMFLVEGLPAALFAVVVWKVLPDGPASAPWLKPGEARIVLDQLEQERVAAAGDGSVKKVFTHPQVLIAVFVYFCHQVAVYSVTFFLPGIIRSWGSLGEIQIGLLTSLPWITAALGAAFLPKVAVARGLGRAVMIAGLFVIALALTGPAFLSPVFALAAFCIATFLFFPVQSVLFTYPSARFSGPALAAGLGYLNALGIVGGFIGPSMMGLVEERTGKATNGLLLISAALVLAALASFFLRKPDQDAVGARLDPSLKPVA
jgi:MFS family permease